MRVTSLPQPDQWGLVFIILLSVSLFFLFARLTPNLTSLEIDTRIPHSNLSWVSDDWALAVVREMLTGFRRDWGNAHTTQVATARGLATWGNVLGSSFLPYNSGSKL